jgi:hypothetical protein
MMIIISSARDRHVMRIDTTLHKKDRIEEGYCNTEIVFLHCVTNQHL